MSPDDTRAPPSDLDVPAARAAARHHAAAVARGIPEAVAWAESVSLFHLHHPAWPLPLAEREAARTVGALIARTVAAPATLETKRPPTSLVRRLSTPILPGANPPFRAAWIVANPLRIAPLRLPVHALPSRGITAPV